MAEVIQQIKLDQVSWLNFDSLHDVDLITEVGTHFNIHNLTLEDIVHVGHMPKIEEYENYLYFTLKMIKPNLEDGSFNDRTCRLCNY